MRGGIHIGIPRSGHRAASGAAVPPFAARALSWTRGDVAIRTAGLYDSLTESGTLGGSFVFEGSRPVDTVQFADLKHVPSYTSTQRMRSTLANTAWSFLHNGTRSFTVSGRFYLKSVVNGARLFRTYDGSSSNRGLLVVVSGTSLALYIGNGTASTIITSPVTLSANTWYTFIVTYTMGGNYTLQVDNSAVASSAHTPSAGAAVGTAYIGNEGSGGLPLNGFMAEVVVHDIVLNAAQLTTLRNYYAMRWSSVPGVVVYLDADNGLGIVGGLVSTWADQAVGNNLADNGVATRPALVSPWRNGMNALQFGPPVANAYLFRAALLSGTLAQPSGIYIVGEYPPSISTTQQLTASGTLATSNNDYITASAQYSANAGAVISATLAGAGGQPFVNRVHYNGATSVAESTLAGGAVFSVTGNVGSQARTGLMVGANATPGAYWRGKVAKVLLIDHVPSAAGHNEIIDALRAEYNI